jgi:hypothetical protein
MSKWLIAICLLTTGCGPIREKICFEGVTYLRFNRGVSVQLDAASKVVRCGP